MTPNDIATDVTAVPNFGSVNMSANYTKTYQDTDDMNTWD